MEFLTIRQSTWLPGFSCSFASKQQMREEQRKALWVVFCFVLWVMQEVVYISSAHIPLAETQSHVFMGG